MKKFITSLCALMLTGSLVNANAQDVSKVPYSPQVKISNLKSMPTAPAMAPPSGWFKCKTTKYTVTDIKGNVYDFDAILKSGKKIFIDFSAIWCGPCWKLHKSGNLEKIQEHWKDQLLVLWVDVDGNEVEAIEGKVKGKHDAVSQGDWTEGGKWPIPIISDENLSPTILGYKIEYIPVMFLIDIDGSAKSVSAWDGVNGLQPDMDECLGEIGDVKIINVKFSDGLAGSPCNFSARYKAATNNVSYSWKFENGNPATSTAAEPKVTWNKKGSYKVSLTIKNNDSNKEATYNGTINIRDKEIVENFPFYETFDGPLTKWYKLDFDGDGRNWISITDIINSMENKSKAESTFKNLIYNGNDSYSSWSYYPSSINDKGQIAGSSVTADQMLCTPFIKLPADKEMVLTFYTRSVDGNNYADNMGVFASSTGLDESDFSTTLMGVTKITSGTMNNKYIKKEISLEKFKGQTISIGFRHKDSDKLAILLDDVIVDKKAPAGTETVKEDEISYRQTDDEIILHGNDLQKVQLIDIAGRVVAQATGTTEATLEISNLPKGVYIMKIVSSKGIATSVKLAI